MTAAPSRRARWLAALGIGAASAVVAVLRQLHFALPPDLVQVWFGARAMLRGANPYSLVGPGLEFDWPWHLYYPATALVATIPLVPFPSPVAVALFVGMSGTLLAYAVTEHSWDRLWIFCSIPWFVAAIAASWSPLLSAALFLPPLAVLFVAKPNLGLAFLLATGSDRVQRYAVGGGLVLLILSIIAFPEWPIEWWRALGHNVQRAPVTRLGGPLILLALLRWRRPEARLIVAMACVPQTAYWNEIVPLMLVPSTRREIQAFSLITASGVILERLFIPTGTEIEVNRQLGNLMVLAAYLPAVLLVLRRPNEGALTPSHLALERFMTRLRTALRPPVSR